MLELLRFVGEIAPSDIGNAAPGKLPVLRWGANRAFLGGLEYKIERAIEVPLCGKIFGGCQQHCGVPIMAAGMHQPGAGAAPGQAGLLLDR